MALTDALDPRLSAAQQQDPPPTSMTPLRLSPTAHVSEYVAVYPTEVGSMLDLTHER